MPISIDDFESHAPEDRPTNAERVIRFLVRNQDQAYKAVEIAESTGVSRNSIHPVLKRLEERGLIRHREPYWAIGDLDAVRDAAVLHSTSTFLDSELGEERREEWVNAARDSDNGADR